jgi:aminoglycoside phosphotransferase (APT) family kinase protein
MANPLDVTLLRAAVARHTGAADDAVRLDRIPTGKFNTSYFVRAGGQDLVLRVAPPRDAVFCFYERAMMRQEPGIHALLLEKTRVPVAPVVAYDDSHALLPRDFLLLERLPGAPMSSAVAFDEDRVLAQVGEALAETHAQQAKAHGYLGEHRPMDPQPSWTDAFVVMWRKLVDDVAAVGYYDAAERDGLLRLLDRHRPAFTRASPACLLHMDVWAQNILVEDGALSGLIDWDRALWGDPEIEFAVLDYCGISRPAFWEGYGAARDESPEARVRTLFYLLYEIQKYIVIRHGRNGDPASALAYKQQVMDIARRALG